MVDFIFIIEVSSEAFSQKTGVAMYFRCNVFAYEAFCFFRTVVAVDFHYLYHINSTNHVLLRFFLAHVRTAKAGILQCVVWSMCAATCVCVFPPFPACRNKRASYYCVLVLTGG